MKPSNTPYYIALPDLTHASSISLGRMMSGLTPPYGGPRIRSLASQNTYRLPGPVSLPPCHQFDLGRPRPPPFHLFKAGPLLDTECCFLSELYDFSLLRFRMLLFSFLSGLVTGTACGA